MLTTMVPVGGCTPFPTPVTSFSPTDARAILYFYVTGAVAGDSVRTEWYDPNGTLVTPPFGGHWTSSGGAECFNQTLPIAGTANASLTGTWTVRVFWNITIITELTFSIGTPGPGPGPTPGGNLVQNGSFELPGGVQRFRTAYADETFITAWQITRGSVDYTHTSFLPASDGEYSVDLDGMSPGTIAQILNTAAYTTYTLMFDMAPNTGGPPTVKRVEVRAAGQSQTFEWDPSLHSGWITHTWTFTSGMGNTALEFISLTTSPNCCYGAMIDNVRVFTGAAPGPSPDEPAVVINQVVQTGCPSTRLVVSVRDYLGAAITGLTTANFTLKENGTLLPITVSPVSTTSALSLAILIDTSTSLSATDLANEKAAAKELINQLPSTDEVAIYAFGSTVSLVQNFTANKIALHAAIDSITTAGATALYAAIDVAAKALLSRTGRKAIVLMTDGENTLIGVTLEQAIASAQQAGAPVFPVGFGSANHAILTQIAQETGGFHSQSASSADLQNILRTLGQTISSQYEVIYTTLDINVTHTIELTVTIGIHVIVVTRTVSPCSSAGGGLHVIINQVITVGCPSNRLIVSVTDGQGRAILGLTQANFTLRENLTSRSIVVTDLSSGGGTSALSLALVIDHSTSLSDVDLVNMKAAAKALVNQLPVSAMVAVYAFGTASEKLLDFTTNRPAIDSAIDSITRSGSTRMYDTLILAAQDLGPRTGRKAIVLLTDGNDNQSNATLDQCIAQAQTAGAAVFPVGFGSVDDSVLQRLASETGGIYSRSATSADLQQILQSIGQVISSQYEITYTTLDISIEHTIEITVTWQGLIAVVTRRVSPCGASAGVVLVLGSAIGSPGRMVDVPIDLRAVGVAPSAFQLDVGYDGSRLVFNSARAGSALQNALKNLSSQSLSGSQLRLVGAGLNQNLIANGTVALLSFTLNNVFTTGSTTLSCSNAQSVDALSLPLPTTCQVGTITATGLRCGCDVNGDGSINVADVQLIINQVLGVVIASCDVDGNGSIDVGDVQKVTNAVLGLGCN